MKRRNDDDYLYPALLIAAPAALGAMVLAMRGKLPLETCWIYEHLGVYCPGCGGTRAVLALLRGRLLAALYYHPAVPLLAAALAVYLPVQTVCRLARRPAPRWCRYRPWWLWGLIGLLLVNCLVRNVLWLGFRIPI